MTAAAVATTDVATLAVNAATATATIAAATATLTAAAAVAASVLHVVQCILVAFVTSYTSYWRLNLVHAHPHTTTQNSTIEYIRYSLSTNPDLIILQRKLFTQQFG